MHDGRDEIFTTDSISSRAREERILIRIIELLFRTTTINLYLIETRPTNVAPAEF